MKGVITCDHLAWQNNKLFVNTSDGTGLGDAPNRHDEVGVRLGRVHDRKVPPLLHLTATGILFFKMIVTLVLQ